MWRKLGIEPGEGRVFAWGTAVLALTGWADAALRNVAETLFLKRVGVDLLPLVFLANAALLVFSTGWVGSRIARGDRLRLLPRTLLVLALLLLPLAWLAQSGVEPALHGLLIASKQLPTIALLVFWSAMGDLLHARQAKRLFAPLLGGFTLGGIAGSFASEPLGSWLGVAGLIPCAAAVLLAAAATALPMRTLRPLRLDRGAAPALSSPPEAPSLPEIWRTSRLFRLLAISALCTGLLGPMLYYQFSYVADLATAGLDGEHRLLAFYARFRGWINSAALLLQLLVTTRLYRRIGVPLASLISPVVYLIGFAGLSLRLSLPTGVFAMAGTKLGDTAVYDPAQRIFYSLFPESLRAHATAWLEGLVKRLGGVLGNLAILGAVALGGAAVVGEAALPVVVLWVAASVLLWRRYPALLLEASAQRSPDLLDPRAQAALLDPATVRTLAAELRTDDAEKCRLAISLLSDAPHETAVRAFAEAARDAPAATRGLLIDALDRLLEGVVASPVRVPEAAEALAKLLESPAALSVREHSDLVQAYSRLAPDEMLAGSDLLERALRQPERAVRLAALAALHQRGRAGEAAGPLDPALAEAVAGEDADARRTAREELRSLLLATPPDADWTRRLEALARLLAWQGDRAETAEALAEVARRRGAAAARVAPALLAWCEDPDPRLRAALLRFSGHAGLRERAAWLVAHLGGSPDLSLAAREGLRALGPSIVDVLLVEVGFGMRSKRDAVLGVVRELALDRATLRSLYERELATIRDSLIKLAALSGSGIHAVVLQRLEERLAECLRTALCYLAAGHEDDRIGELGELLPRADTHRQHAILLEALESLLTPREQQELIPLLEDPTVERRGRAAAQALRIELPSREAAARALLEDPDELVRLLARATPGAETLAAGGELADATRVLTPVEIMLHLRSLPIFERLTTRQLMDLALAVSEEDHAAGDAIVREGEFSDCLYLVVDGRVQITKSGKHLAEQGARSFFGEVAIFEGAARSATVQAVVPTRVLRLGRAELLRLMEEFPAIAIGVCQNLSRRVRELSDRVTG